MLHKIMRRLLLGFEDIEVHLLVVKKKTRGITKEKREIERKEKKGHTHNKQPSQYEKIEPDHHLTKRWL